ncbi:MAG: universal stress protein [Gammaproteobacteria bacterium]|nr:universal stress protein [Gammaproteobacteria bacterium]MDH5729945.1 universal stress protein [Gammaproteobacteria bacterium]
MALYQSILVAVDLSADAKTVISKAHSLSQQFSAKLTLLTVVEPLVTETGYDLLPVLSVDVEKSLVDRAQHFLVEIAAELGINDCHKQVEIGSVKGEVLRVVADAGHDLVVLGTHGRHGFATLLGSTANAILHGTPCDVLAVRVGGK